VSFARFWEENEQYDDARKVFEKALNVNYKKVEELAAVWTDYVEFELRRHNYDRARELIQRATVVPKNRAIPRDAPVSKRVYKSTRLWALYADLEENLGTFMTTKAVYEKIIDLRLITPQMTINYAHWLEEHNHFEESFKAYERGIALFQFPHVTELWITYLTKFMRRYGGTKLERLRDLFEQAIESAPAKEVTLFYLMYAEAEEKYGLARHVLHIFDRATRHVHAEDRPFIFNLYIAKATEFFGVTRTREIFEKAIESLPEKQVREYCFRFANLERKLGEIDRARAIYIHCSQFCDPRTEQKFWETWKEFEVRHGNVETFKEMLRIKRSVTAQYSIAVQVPLTVAAPKSTDQEDHMKQLEEQQGGAAPAKRFVSGSTLQPEELGMAPSEAAANARPATSANTEEIELDMDEGEQEEEEEEDAPKPKKNVQLEEIRVPSAVFGGLVDESARDEDNNGDAQGAKDRLKKRKRGPNH
jgi:pre-mRNA-splicing factor SYF1